MFEPLMDIFAGPRRRRAAGEAAANAAKRGDQLKAHHHIFEQFQAFDGQAPLDVHVCYIGDRVGVHLVSWEQRRRSQKIWPVLPDYDEEYFEWVDVLEAVHAAGETFTMLELGAGFGRWSVRGALAARQLGKAVRLGLAEAEPKHIGWLKGHLAANDVAEREYRVFPVAVGGGHTVVDFVVGKALAEGEEWFGQQVISVHAEGRPVVGDYHGLPLVDAGGGFTAISVQQIPLSEILGQYGPIDIIDFDLQGTEADAIEEAVGPLTRQVRRLHIGTHGEDIEARLRKVLAGAGWVCLRDYSLGQTNETPFGSISFVDGVQSWINPRRL